MAIISQETFEKFSKEEKEKLRKYLNNYSEKIDNVKNIADDIFGKENLQPKSKIKINIKTWDDVEQLLPEDGFCVGEFEKFADNPKITIKCQATLKIAKLIELGYGGLLSKEQYEKDGAWQIIPYRNAYNENFKLKIVYGYQYKTFISFCEEEYAKNFMSYSENRKLVKQYYTF